MGSFIFFKSEGDHIGQFLGAKSGKPTVIWMYEMLIKNSNHVYGNLAVVDYPRVPI